MTDKIIGCNPDDPNACQVRSGIYINIFDFKREDVRKEDIIHALSNICRFGGHSSAFYSVAQHSVHVAERVLERTGNPDWALIALYHDAHEAYTGDIPRPIKYHRQMEYLRDIMLDVQITIEEALGVQRGNPSVTAAIKAADNDLLSIEALYFMVGGGREWYWGEMRPSFHRLMINLDPLEARRLFEDFERELQVMILEEQR